MVYSFSKSIPSNLFLSYFYFYFFNFSFEIIIKTTKNTVVITLRHQNTI